MKYFLSTALILIVATMALETHAQEWHFNVTLDGKPFGNHTFKLSTDGQQKILVSDANFKYKILGITAYRYVHIAEEHWQGNDCPLGEVRPGFGRRDGSRSGSWRPDGPGTNTPGARIPSVSGRTGVWPQAAHQYQQLAGRSCGPIPIVAEYTTAGRVSYR